VSPGREQTGAAWRLVSASELELEPGLRQQAIALRRAAWPGIRTEPVHDPALAPLALLLLEGERVVASLDILTKTISHRDEQFRASGLSSVVTDAALRRRGHGRRLVAAARELIAARGDDLGIFTADAPLEGFYTTAGWQLLPGSVLVGGTPEEPFPSDQFDKLTFACFFSPRARSAAAGFAGARIELYPGAIDRLW
jgi:GNAT superfamily N-acetyltransferase